MCTHVECGAWAPPLAGSDPIILRVLKGAVEPPHSRCSFLIERDHLPQGGHLLDLGAVVIGKPGFEHRRLAVGNHDHILVPALEQYQCRTGTVAFGGPSVAEDSDENSGGAFIFTPASLVVGT